MIIIQRKIKITEIYNAKEKDIEEKLKEIFVIYLTEKLINTVNTKENNNFGKDIEKSCKKMYNRNSWIEGTYCYRKERI